MTLNPQAYRKVEFIHRIGLAANKPNPADVLIGTLYLSTDTGTLERSNGSAWVAYSGSGGGSSVAGLDMQVQFNKVGILGASPDFKYDDAKKQVYLGGQGVNSWREGIIQLDTYGYLQTNGPNGYLALCGGLGEDPNNGAILYLSGSADNVTPGYGNILAWLGNTPNSSFIVMAPNGSDLLFRVYNNGNVEILNNIAIGINPAQSGAIRLPNLGSIVFRNAANTNDVAALYVHSDNVVYVGSDIGSLYLKSTGVITFTSGGGNLYLGGNQFMPYEDGIVNLGNSANKWKDLYLSGTVHSAALDARIAALEARIAALEAR